MKPQPDSLPDEPRAPRWWQAAWLKWLAIGVLFIVGFYVHQDLLGAMAWKKMQRDVAAAGESLDPASLLPKPVPDDQNLGALPIFQLSQYPGGEWDAQALQAALAKVQDQATSKGTTSATSGELPFLGRWRNGEKLDRATVQKRLAELCHEPPTSHASSLELYAKLCPALAPLRAANATHPECSFPQDPHSLTWEKSLGIVTRQIKLAKVLAYEERLALDAGQTDLALQDLRLAWKMNSGIRKETTLVAGLVSLAAVTIQMEIVLQGLAEHAWNDAQLAEIDQDLGGIDFLADYQQCMRGEALNSILPVTDYIKQKRGMLLNFLGGGNLQDNSTSWIGYLIFWSVPAGWFDQFKADNVGFRLLALVPMADPSIHRVFPEKEAHMQVWVEGLHSTSYWHDFVNISCQPISMSVKRFTQGQIQVDEARIACRLERYRLAHGAFPETLALLEPTYGPNPLDPVIGEPFRYHRNADGTYVLYSIGWNQKDDGGNVAGTPDEALDWGWLNQPVTP